MMNKKPTSGSAAWKNLLVIPMVMFLLLVFSFKSAPNSEQQPNLSQESSKAVLNCVYDNFVFPQEAIDARITATIVIIVEFGTGGKIKNVTAEVGGNGTTDMTGTKVQELIKNEGIRVGKTIESLNLPEFKTENFKLTIPVTITTK